MKKSKGTSKKNDTKNATVLHLAFELSETKWKLGFSDGKKMRFVSMAARNLLGFIRHGQEGLNNKKRGKQRRVEAVSLRGIIQCHLHPAIPR